MQLGKCGRGGRGCGWWPVRGRQAVWRGRVANHGARANQQSQEREKEKQTKDVLCASEYLSHRTQPHPNCPVQPGACARPRKGLAAVMRWPCASSSWGRSPITAARRDLTAPRSGRDPPVASQGPLLHDSRRPGSGQPRANHASPSVSRAEIYRQGQNATLAPKRLLARDEKWLPST